MRKGFTLVELLVVMLLILLVSVTLAKLTKATLLDIPKANKTIEENSSMLRALKEMQKDINIAKGFPEKLGTYTANDKTLLIELSKQTICYQIKDGKLLRLELLEEGGVNEQTVSSWTIPNGKIQWHVWRNNGKGYAAEIQTYIEQNIQSIVEKKMANSHLYFVGAYQEGEN